MNGGILPLSSKTMTWLNLDRMVIMYKRLSVADRQQAEFTRPILFVNGQVIRMVRQSQLAQNKNSCQEGDCESAFHQIRNYQI